MASFSNAKIEMSLDDIIKADKQQKKTTFNKKKPQQAKPGPSKAKEAFKVALKAVQKGRIAKKPVSQSKPVQNKPNQNQPSSDQSRLQQIKNRLANQRQQPESAHPIQARLTRPNQAQNRPAPRSVKGGRVQKRSFGNGRQEQRENGQVVIVKKIYVQAGGTQGRGFGRPRNQGRQAW